jgi:hypothetical protein
MEETREQQQMYSMFRSCIYVILDSRDRDEPSHHDLQSDDQALSLTCSTASRSSTLLAYCKLMEFICITVTCIGTKAQKSLTSGTSRRWCSIQSSPV